MLDTTYQKLLESSFRFISYRPRSEKEITDFLVNKLRKWDVYGPNLVEKVLNRLQELKYVDDVAFATWWVDQRQGRKPKGLKVIKYELSNKGVARDIIEHILSSISNNQIEMAKKAIESKRKSVKDPQKLFNFLIRRGFDVDSARAAIDATGLKQ